MSSSHKEHNGQQDKLIRTSTVSQPAHPLSCPTSSPPLLPLLPSCVLSERECRNQRTEAVQPKCGQARERDGVRQHKASQALRYEERANQKGVRFRPLPAHLPSNCRSRSNTHRKGLVPALVSLNTHIKGNPSLTTLPELRLPPSPVLPAQPLPSITPYDKTFEVNPENPRLGVTQDLSIAEDVWRLSTDNNAKAPDPSLLRVHMETHPVAVLAVVSTCYTRSRLRRTQSVRFEIISFPCPTNKASADHSPGRLSAPHRSPRASHRSTGSPRARPARIH